MLCWSDFEIKAAILSIVFYAVLSSICFLNLPKTVSRFPQISPDGRTSRPLSTSMNANPRYNRTPHLINTLACADCNREIELSDLMRTQVAAQVRGEPNPAGTTCGQARWAGFGIAERWCCAWFETMLEPLGLMWPLSSRKPCRGAQRLRNPKISMGLQLGGSEVSGFGNAT